MIKLSFALVVTALCLSCSAPKYTYYFDRYSVKSSPHKQGASALSNAKESRSESNVTLGSRALVAYSTGRIQDETLLASSSSRESYSSQHNEVKRFNSPKISLLKQKREDRKILMRTMKEFHEVIKSQEAHKEGDKGKNGVAVAGLISLLIGAGVLIAGSGLGLLFCGLALILSLIGLKSELRELASAVIGLMLGALLLFLVFVAFILLTWQFTL